MTMDQPTMIRRVRPPVSCEGHVWSGWRVERDSRPGDPQFRTCLLCDAQEEQDDGRGAG